MADPSDGTSTALSEAELVFERWIAQDDGGDIEGLCRDHPELEGDLRRLEASYARASAALGSVACDPRAELERVLERLGRPDIALGYEDQGEVARGGMGVIRRVWDARLRRTLAMKVLSLGQGGSSRVGRRVERFLGEARIAGSLQHPGVAPVHDVGLSPDGKLYFTMPLIEGEDLRPGIARLHAGEEGWTLTRLLWNLVHVCETMAYAHSRGVVHRDLKPANVMVGRFGEVRVMDWGLAKVLGESEVVDIRPAGPGKDGPGDGALRTMDGDVLGTPGYMSPEQAAGRLDEVGVASDVYSIGCMLYHVLGGRAPYSSSGSSSPSPVAVLGAVRAGAPEPLEQLAPRAPTELVAICERAMARDAKQRYPDTEELGRDLRAWLEGRVVRAYEAGAWAELRKWVSRNRALAAAIAAAVLAVVGGSTAVAVVQARAGRDLRDNNLLLKEANRVAEERLASLRRSQYFNSLALAQQAYDSASTANMRSLLDEVDPELRGWEWIYLDRLADSSLLTMRGHTARIVEVAWSPTGDRLASASGDRTVRVWDAATGAELHTLDAHGDLVEDVVFSSDGSTIASAGRDGTARLWDAASGEELATIVTGDSSLEAVAISPAGTPVATGGADAVARLWDVTGRPVGELSTGGQHITALDFSPDGALLAAGAYDGTVQLWSLESKALLRELTAVEDGRVRSVRFAPDGRTVFASSTGRDVIAWRVDGGEIWRRFRGSAASHPIALAPAGDQLATAEFATVRLWDVEREGALGLLCGHEATVYALAFSPSGDRLASGGGDLTLRLWDPRSAPDRVVLAEAAEDYLTDLAFTPDGRHVAWGARDGRLRLASAGGGEVLRTFEPQQGWVTSVAFDPIRPVILSGGSDGSVVLRDLEGAVEQRIPGDSRVWRIVLDGDLMATAHEDGTARVWDLVAQRAVFNAQFGQRLTGLDLDRGRLLVARYDGRVQVLELDTARAQVDIDASEDVHPSVAFSPDGRSFAVGSGDRTVRLYDAESGELRFSAEGHESGVTGAVFTPDGSRLVTSGNDGLVKLWDAESGRLALTLRADERGLAALALSPDGASIAGASYSRTVFVWDAR